MQKRLVSRFRRTLRVGVLALLLLGLQHRPSTIGEHRLPGPGIPKVRFESQQLFQFIATIPTSVVPHEHAQAVMHDGYLVIPYSRETAVGGFAFFDISNPMAPKLVHTLANFDTREGHSIGFSHSYPGLYAVTQASFGLTFWDWTDVRSPRLLSRFRLPGILPSDYNHGAWWVSWQAPHVFVGGSSKGLYVVDASFPENPQLSTRLPISATGGFRVGSVSAIGNLLVISGNEVSGISTMDISNPLEPKLLGVNNKYAVYSSVVNGNKVYAAGLFPEPGVLVFDISDPRTIRFERRYELPDRIGYLAIQDEFVHVGAGGLGYMKLDLRQPDTKAALIGAVDFKEAKADVDFVAPLGNLVVLSDDEGFGSKIVAHQSEPDTNPPKVTMISPQPGAVLQATTSRVGLTFSDQIDLRSVHDGSFIVQETGGLPLAGKYSGQHNVVNFSPAQPLKPDASYRVSVVKGGIKDLAGNAVAEGFYSTFATGRELRDISCSLSEQAPVQVGQAVTLRAHCEGANLRYTWNPGDHSPGDDAGVRNTSSESSFTHTFTRPGHYSVLFSVKNESYETSFLFRQLVYSPPAAEAPLRTKSLLYDRIRERLLLVNPDSNTVTAIDAKTYQPVFETTVGENPRTLTLHSAGSGSSSADEIWVANRESSDISVLDASSGRLKATIPLSRGSLPYGILAVPSGQMYVTLEGTGMLAVLDSSAKTLIRTVAVGPAPRGIAVTHDGSRIFVARFLSPKDQGEVIELSQALEPVTRYQLAKDPGPDTQLSGRGVPNYLQLIALTPDESKLWIPAKKDNTDRGLFLSKEADSTHNIVRSVVLQLDLSSNREVPALRRDLDNRGLPAAITFSALGDYAFVSTLASNTIDILDANTGNTVSSIENSGIAPIDLSFANDDSRLFVLSYLTRELIVYDTSSVGRQNSFTMLAKVHTTQHEALPYDVLRGKQIFYNSADNRMSRDKYLSCAVCHLDGESDQRVWDFTGRGEGLRNTISLRGQDPHTAGYLHWSANFDEIQDFERDIRGAFGGRGFLPPGRENLLSGSPLESPLTGLSKELDQLAAYIHSLRSLPNSPFRQPDGQMTPDALAGKALFYSERTGCAGCHDAPLPASASTLPELKDVGTISLSSGMRLGQKLNGFDIPSLHGVWFTAPYFHDGSAETLFEVVEARNAGDHHGHTAALTQAERQQLVAYLEQLDASLE